MVLVAQYWALVCTKILATHKHTVIGFNKTIVGLANIFLEQTINLDKLLSCLYTFYACFELFCAFLEHIFTYKSQSPSKNQHLESLSDYCGYAESSGIHAAPSR